MNTKITNLELAENLRLAHITLLDPEVGFLPKLTPADTLPEQFKHFLTIVDELPFNYHGYGLSVRSWLNEKFSEHDADSNSILQKLQQPERDRLMTAVSVLAHAYRWDCAPPKRDAYELKAITLPVGLAEPWRVLSKEMGHPRVGNLYSMVLSNWSMKGVKGGSSYFAADIIESKISPRCLWLTEPESDALSAFLLTGIETEAKGAPAIKTVVDLVSAAARRDMPFVIFLLERLRTEIKLMGDPFKRLIQNSRITPSAFMQLIQPTTIWGLDEGNGPLEGASGPQVGSIQCIDAVLGVPKISNMSHAIERSRAYLPKVQRDFLSVVDTCSNILRTFVANCDDGRLTGEFNGCLMALRAWRLVHKARGATYLKPDKEIAGYASTGGVVELDAKRVTAFEQEMDGRVSDLAQAKIQPSESTRASEALYRFLWPEDLIKMRAVGSELFFLTGDEILSVGKRQFGLFLIEEGEVEVRSYSKVINTFTKGDMYGQMTFIDNSEAYANVVAKTNGKLLHIPSETAYSIFEADPNFALRFFQFTTSLLAGRLRNMHDTISALHEREKDTVLKLSKPLVPSTSEVHPPEPPMLPQALSTMATAAKAEDLTHVLKI